MNGLDDIAGEVAPAAMLGGLWERFRSGADPTARQHLLALYIGLVHRVARDVARAKGIEPERLVSAGTLGLVRALGSFDSKRGTAFNTHAVRLIRGAILDDLRGGWRRSPAVQARARRIEVATTALRCRLSRAPRPEEIAAQLEIDLSTYRRWRDEAGLGEDAGDHVPDPLEDQAAAVRQMLGRLPKMQRIVVALTWYERMDDRQIAEATHLPEAQIGEIRAKAFAALRARLSRAG